MKMNVCNLIGALVDYAIANRLADELDRTFYCNRLMEELKVSAFEPDADVTVELPLEEILGALCDYAIENGVIAEVAAEDGYIKPEDVQRLIKFRNNPSDESWIGGQA